MNGFDACKARKGRDILGMPVPFYIGLLPFLEGFQYALRVRVAGLGFRVA